MISPLHIQPDAIYDDGVLSATLGLSASVVSRARREGRLRFVREGKRVLYLGKWVIAWLTCDCAGACGQGAVTPAQPPG